MMYLLLLLTSTVLSSLGLQTQHMQMISVVEDQPLELSLPFVGVPSYGNWKYNHLLLGGSSTKAEFFAVIEAGKICCFLWMVMAQLEYKQAEPTTIYIIFTKMHAYNRKITHDDKLELIIMSDLAVISMHLSKARTLYL